MSKDLTYVADVDVRKPHMIFQKNDTYFVLTVNSGKKHEHKDTRGMFFKLYKCEIHSVKHQLGQQTIPKVFDCNKIVNTINGIYGSRKLRKNINSSSNKPEYLISRLRNICYVLVAEGYLHTVRQGNALFFKKTSKLKY